MGQLGNGSFANSPTPVAVSGLTGATALALGTEHSCAIVAGGGGGCWGSSLSGQLGNGSTTWSSTAVDVLGVSGVTALTGRRSHT